MGRGQGCGVRGVVSGTVDTPERPDEALTGPSKTGPVCCGTSTARRPHGRPFAGHRGGGHQTCATGLGRVGRRRGVRCGARLLEPYPRLNDRRSPGSGARNEIDAPPANVCGAKGVCPAKYFSGLPILGRGNLVGGPPRCAGAQRRRVVSLGRACRRRPRSTRVGRCQARSDAVARGACTRGGWGGRGSVGRCGGGSQPSDGSYILSLA